MATAHRLTTLQLGALLLAAGLFGACATLVAGPLAPARAEAARLEPPAPPPASTSAQPAEKKRAGRPVVHFEIGCRDSAKTREFYTRLFDWRIEAAGPAAVIQTGGGRGIDGHITALGHEPHHYVTVYVEVDDIQSYLDKTIALGGKKLVGPIKIPTGHFAWLSDPDGNLIGLLQP